MSDDTAAAHDPVPTRPHDAARPLPDWPGAPAAGPGFGIPAGLVRTAARRS